jgi:dolichyl-phosphate beta-glucosyltransferase
VAHQDPSIDLSIVIPAYNEAERLPEFLGQVLMFAGSDARRIEVVVVDDGSSDGTADYVRGQMPGAPLRLIRHLQNAGKGAAVRTGMLHARGAKRLFADADGATGMTELAVLEAADAPVAIASREKKGAVVQASKHRRFLGRWFNRAVRMGAVPGLQDTQCGFKLFSTPEAIELFAYCREDGYAFDVEVLMLAHRRGIKVAEVPVRWTEIPGSKVSVLKDGMKMLKAVRRIKGRWRQGGYAEANKLTTPCEEVEAP